MKTTQAIRERRAVKHFDPDFIIPDAHEREMMDLLRESPTSFNIQNWRFVLVKNPDLRVKLRAAAWSQAQITDASLVFVLCADLKAWEKNPARYWENAPKDVQDFLVPAICQFYQGRDWQQRDEAMRSVGIASQTLMLAAKALGYDSCPMIRFDPEQVGKLINLPQDHVIGMIVTVGKALSPARAKGGYIPDSEVFFTDEFLQSS